jgi:hypothetical protein
MLVGALTAPEPPAPEPGANAKRRPVFARHRELLAAVASGFVGALALATSTYNVYLQRQQVRAQVWPSVGVSSDFNNGVFTVTLRNRGVGPALVRRVRVTVDGQRAADWFDAERRVLRRSSFDMWSAGVEPVENQVLAPGAELLTFKVAFPADARGMFFGADRLATNVCYCSTLGECWVYTEVSALEPGSTRPTDECAPDPVPFRAATHETLAALQASVVARLKDAGAPD